MSTEQFLEYLHDRPATRTLADDFAAVLVLRRGHVGAPTAATTPDPRRIAS